MVSADDSGLPGDLDVSGWELRKSLRLFSKCNLALNEWIGSPVLYQETPGFRSEVSTLILYATRALMDCRWIAHYQSQPPTEFLSLVRNLALADERSQIEQLVLKKSSADEKAEMIIGELRRAEIRSELDAFDRTDFAFEKPTKPTVEKLDTILRRWARIGSDPTKLRRASS